MNVNLNHIRSFLAVSQTLNFTNAAKLNGVPQSTISRQINDLEQQLNVTLFYRTKRDVQLTEEGRTFLPYANEILEAATKGSYAVKQLHDGAQGRLSVSTIATSGEFLTRCLHDFNKKYPDIVVDVTFISGDESLQDEGRDPYDFHFMHEDTLPDQDDFETMVTHRDELCIVHNRKRKVSLKKLNDERFILVSEGESPILHKMVNDYFSTLSFEPTIFNVCDDVHAVLISVAADMGITILPQSQPEEFMAEKLRLIPLARKISYGVAWKKELLNPAANLFLEVLQQHVAK